VTPPDRLSETIDRLRSGLLDAREPTGHWVGRLATSALSTATAAIALHLTDADAHHGMIVGALDWLAANPNDDGGYGDTTASKSNINTTALCWAAFSAAPETRSAWDAAEAGAERWLASRGGSTDPDHLAETILAFYGKDRTFSTPILTALSLMGRLGPREEAFRRIPALPFELAAVPQPLWRWLGLPVVSYALPALVAVGQTRHHFAPTRNPLTGLARTLTRRRTIRLVRTMQAGSGGFLEAIPLTSFVTACLTSIGLRDHMIVREALRFLREGARDDGGWPIDTCLETWVTTLSVAAIDAGGDLGEHLSVGNRQQIVRWLTGQQYDYVHPFTNVPPGGFSWMNADGAVPDADDTPGAMLALKTLAPTDPRAKSAAERAARWLLAMQNRDGGMPTFCRGWGKLPFDRSAADITAHALRALLAWRSEFPAKLTQRANTAIAEMQRYLVKHQQPDGSWLPLWFGNEWIDDDRNPTYGTGRVLTALTELPAPPPGAVSKASEWLRDAQNDDGSWGGGPGGKPSIEETGIALEALSRLGLRTNLPAPRHDLADAVARGAGWLIDATNVGRTTTPAPIGLYFAKLWYSEQLYPAAFALPGLLHARRFLSTAPVDE
jgi:squalene-hopene/tetraprenyl-beta-curcumene cyclase